MRIALAITTYERPEALGAVLASVARQRVLPDEVVVADDGSSAPVRETLEGLIARSPLPIRLVSQPHDGFRVARLRNLAIAAVSAEYLVLVDGDMLLHPEFIADHARLARRGFYTQGVRVRGNELLTAGLLENPGSFPSILDAGLGLLRRVYLLHSPLMAGMSRRLANGLIAVKACNQGLWRADLLRVNGFNEDIVGWGPEDKEMCARLEHAGVRRQSLLFGGIACHLHHAPESRQFLAANRAVFAATRRERRTRCDHGLDSHLRA